MSLVDNQRPLQPEYVPGSITDRESERKALKQALNSIHLPNILLHGPRGTGKTLLTRQLITQLEDDIQHHYIDCTHHNTEHKALRKLHTSITGEDTPQGFHTSKLQRKIEKQLKHVRHLIVLDEADFLLQNNGNSLLYYLSRINKPANLGIIIVSAHTASLQSQIDERTYSTLQPRRIGTEPYTSEQVYQILSERARQSLEPTSLHHEALTYLASATENTKLGLHWLRHTAQNTSQPISEETGTPPLHRTNPVTPHRPPPNTLQSHSRLRRLPRQLRTDIHHIQRTLQKTRAQTAVQQTNQRLRREHDLRKQPEFDVREKDARRKRMLAESRPLAWLTLTAARWTTLYGESPWRVIATSLIAITDSDFCIQ